MSEDKGLTILRLARQKTEAKELRWRSTGNDDDVFVHTFPSGFELKAFPHTFYGPSPDGEGPPSLTLFDQEGKLVFDITSDLEGTSVDELSKFYELVRRVTEGVDDKLDAILEELKNTSDEVPF